MNVINSIQSGNDNNLSSQKCSSYWPITISWMDSKALAYAALLAEVQWYYANKVVRCFRENEKNCTTWSNPTFSSCVHVNLNFWVSWNIRLVHLLAEPIRICSSLVVCASEWRNPLFKVYLYQYRLYNCNLGQHIRISGTIL